MINSEFNKNVPYDQYEELDSVLVDDGSGKDMMLKREKGDVIDWMIQHTKDESVSGTSYAGIKNHHGKIKIMDAKDNLFEVAYLNLSIDIIRASKIDAVSKAVADFASQWRSIVVTKKVNHPLHKGEITLVIKLDRRIRSQIVRRANQALAKELEKYLARASTKLDANRHKVFEMADIDITELSDHYAEAKYISYDVHGCKGGNYVVSDSESLYQPDTDDMMTWLESIPDDEMVSDNWKKHLKTHLVSAGIDKKTGEIQRVPKLNKNSRVNANLLMTNMLPGLLKFDDTRQVPVVTRKVVDKKHAFVIKQGPLDAPQLESLAMWLEVQDLSIVLPRKEVEAAALGIADRNHFDSFFDYLASLPKWDGKKRLLRMFTTSLGVEDTPMSRYIALIVTVGMIHISRYPGGKADFIVDLVGEQGLGKTTMIQKLASSFGTKKKSFKKYDWYRPNRGWYTQGFKNILDKDTMLQLSGKIYANDDEMVSSEKSTEAQLKAFATANQLEFRPPYGKTDVTVDRRYLMWRTTNKLEVYISKNGQRKYWPLIVGKEPITTPVVTNASVWTPDFVDQIWAEAVHIYQAKGDQWIAKLIKAGDDERWAKYRDLTHADLQHTDDQTISIVGYIADKMSELKPGQKLRVATQQILDETGIGGNIQNQKLTTKIARIMKNDLLFSHTRVSYKGGKPAGYVSTEDSPKAVKQAVINFKAGLDNGNDDDNAQGFSHDDDDILASLNL